MLIFVFYSIFKLQFDQKKGPILLMAAVNSAARPVFGNLEETLAKLMQADPNFVMGKVNAETKH